MTDVDAIRGQLVDKFKILSQERIGRINNLVLSLERDADDTELQTAVQREIHTLKGEARVLTLRFTNHIAHQTEELIHVACRTGFSARPLVDGVFEGLDLLSALIEGIEGLSEPPLNCETFDAMVAQLLEAHPVDAAPPPPGAGSAPKKASDLAASGANLAVSSIRVDLSKLEQLARLVGEMRLGHLRATGLVDELSALRASYDALSERIDALAAKLGRRPSDDENSDLRQQVADQGEWLRMQIHEVVRRAREFTFDNQWHLDQLAYGVRELHMVPLGPLLDRYPRAVRDLAADLDKRAELHVSGHDVEVDRRVLEQLDEPLLHLIRNAVDHGLELPHVRLAEGKTEVGHLKLEAKLQGTHVEIVLEDDGRGIDIARVRKHAAERRILSPEGAQSTSDAELLELLFTPGFTTSIQVTDVSGRGIGLDVVRARVEQLGGHVGVASEVGRGTRFVLQIPASVTVASALVVASGGQRYGLPSDRVHRALHIRPEELASAGEANVVRLDDGHPVAISDLAALVGGRPASSPGERPAVVLRHPGGLRAFWVDALLGHRDVLQKPPGEFLKDDPLIHSTAFLDDGTMTVILSADALMESVQGAARIARDPPGEARRARRRIVVADDSELTRDLVVTILRDAGYDVAEAVNGQQALEMVAETEPDLVISDLQMPVLDGFGFLREIRQQELGRDLPVVVFSTLGSAADKQQAAALGADAYLVKAQIQQQEILSTIARFLGSAPSVEDEV